MTYHNKAAFPGLYRRCRRFALDTVDNYIQSTARISESLAHKIIRVASSNVTHRSLYCPQLNLSKKLRTAVKLIDIPPFPPESIGGTFASTSTIATS